MNKNVRPATMLGLFLCLAMLCPEGLEAAASGAAAAGRRGAKGKQIKYLNANAWLVKTTNFGPIVWPEGSGHGGFWGGPGYGYIYGGGMWVGAIDTLGSAHVSVGYYGNGGSEMGPVNPFTFEWVNQAVDPQARVYLSTDPADLAEWPVRDAQNRPVVRSVQDGYAVYSDENPAFTFTGETNIGLRVKQWSYAWNYADNNDIVFFYFRVFNVSGDSLRGVYLGPCFDADIGDESGTAANDRTDFDYTRSLAIQYQADPEPGWPKVGQFGCRYFESPANNTGDTVHVIDNQYPHAVLPGAPLGMTAFKIFTIDIDPSTDADRYLVMQGYNYKTMVMDAYDETGTATPGDKRFVMTSGPFNMGAGDSAATCVGIMCADDRTALLQASDVAQEIYNNNFQLAMAPALPVLTVSPGDRRAYLTWTKTAETTPDPFWATIDSAKRWYTYFKGTYNAYGKYRVDTTLIDSLMLLYQAADTHSVVIARGAANPAFCSDTLMCRYDQRAMYAADDFQGYLLYRANTLEDLQDPATRVPIGTLNIGSSGARGYFYDRYDGQQIVLDLQANIYQTPDTTYYLPKYDTIGTDRGLACALTDTGLNNGQAYYYGLAAYDYQPNVYFTKKCPTTLSTSPYDCSAMVIPLAEPPGYQPPGIVIRVDGGCDARYGGALDHFQNLAVADPSLVPADSFRIVWQAPSKVVSGTSRLPFYKGKLYNSGGAYLDSIGIVPQYALHQGTDPGNSFFGTPYDQLGFGGIVFKPFVKLAPWQCLAETMAVIAENPGGSRVYPADSVRVRLELLQTFKVDVAQWMWRGSDFEVRWKDTLVNIGGTDTLGLTCTVWDLTNNVEVPFEGGLSKANMTKQGWCFNYLAGTSGATNYIYKRSNNDNTAMFISGMVVYFNKRGATTRRMDWPNRPETGDVWTVNCSGCATPGEGNVSNIILSPAISGVAGGPAGQSLVAMLHQNAPNPFSGTTEFGYQISKPCRVQLRVYNIAGQLVKTLVDAQQAPQQYGVRWDGRNQTGRKLSAGIYLYRLQAGDKVLTKKLVLVK